MSSESSAGGDGSRSRGGYKRRGRGGTRGNTARRSNNKQDVNLLYQQTPAKEKKQSRQHIAYHLSALSVHPPRKRARPSPPPNYVLTVSDLISDSLTPIANTYWAPGQQEHRSYDPSLIDKIYHQHLHISTISSSTTRATMYHSATVLELSTYLENYLWKYFTSSSSYEHVMSIIILINNKFSQNLPNIWDSLIYSPVEHNGIDHESSSFTLFFDRLLHLKHEHDMSILEATQYLLLFIRLFSSLENPVVRKHTLRLVSLPIWRAVSENTRNKQLKKHSDLQPLWTKIVQQCKSANKSKTSSTSTSATEQQYKQLQTSSTFIPHLIHEFIRLLYTLSPRTYHDQTTQNNGNTGDMSATNHEESINNDADEEMGAKILYCHRFIEFMVDLLSQLPTRRFFHTFFDDVHFLLLCTLSPLHQSSTSSSPSAHDNGLFAKLVNLLTYYHHFDIDDHTGMLVPSETVIQRYHSRLAHLQHVAFHHYMEPLKPLVLANIASINQRRGLIQHLEKLNAEQLLSLCKTLKLTDDEADEGDSDVAAKDKNDPITAGLFTSSAILRSCYPSGYSATFLLELLLSHHLSHPSHQHLIDTLPLYPTETILFDDSQLPASDYTPDTVLALPKLNLQFLSLSDYLLRNFSLYRLEASYEIREDIAYTVRRLRPRLANDGKETVFTGWSRMAVPVYSFAITAVKPPLLGQLQPREVKGQIAVDLAPFTGMVRREWEEIKPFDVLFLLTIRAVSPLSSMTQAEIEREWEEDEDGSKRKRTTVDSDGNPIQSNDSDDVFFGGGGVGSIESTENWRALANEPMVITYVRGCEVVSIADEAGKMIGEREADGKLHYPVGSIRTYHILLDPAQYQEDMSAVASSSSTSSSTEDVYTTFNLLLRRKPQENNFKGVLQSIRDILQKDYSKNIPPFLSDLLLGYGDPLSSQYYRLSLQLRRCVFVDTFLDEKHIQESFVERVIIVQNDEEEGIVGEEQQAMRGSTGASHTPVLDATIDTSMVQASVGITRMLEKLSQSASPSSTSVLSSFLPPSYRLTFTLNQQPNYKALQSLIEHLQYEPTSDHSYHPQISHPHLVHPSVPFLQPAVHQPIPIPPVPPSLPPLVPPPPFAAVEPVFTRVHPVLHVFPPALANDAGSSSTNDAVASSAGAAKIATVQADLSHLTVAQLKAELKQAGLASSGLKAVLIERLAEYKTRQSQTAAAVVNSSKMEDTTIEATATPTPSAHISQSVAEAAGGVDQQRYEAEMAAFEAEKANYENRLSVYREEKSKHDVALQEYEERKKQQANMIQKYQEALRSYEQQYGKQTEEQKETSGDMKDDAMTAVQTHGADISMIEGKAQIYNSATDVSSSLSPSSTSSSSLPPILARPLARIPSHSSHVRFNTVRFTPMQVEAIKAGCNPGLTLIVGPPGTGSRHCSRTDIAEIIIAPVRYLSYGYVLCASGKTDTAVQIIAELYHNHPTQRILLITHSNHALNDLFEKLLVRDIDERYLLRLGHGSEEVASEKDFSKFGRINYMLARRQMLLQEVASLAQSLQMEGDVGYTCETSQHFFLYHLLSRWEKFARICQSSQHSNNNEIVMAHFPFTAYFQSKNKEQPLFYGASFTADLCVAISCFSYLQSIFTEIEECRPFELLRTYGDRAHYLVNKHSKVIAMTCTHAAIKRHEFVEQKLQYDSIIMEESAQVLEIETFIPLVLQQRDTENGSRLQRVVLIGDPMQLPPVVKNRAFQYYSHLDQSLFARLIRLGIPYLQLNAQGRSRASLAALWNWRYTSLYNLPIVVHSPTYRYANVGFRYEYQVINVEDYQGKGETTPTPYYYQNLGEAEYVVAAYQYMRLMGYPSNTISIITTYNGQCHLIKDVINTRCAANPLFGPPAHISTVDQFQGQQNDYILLSLVRTKNIGHLRDIRRLTVAMSRARLGLYVFCRTSLFANCYELTKTFQQLLSRPQQLMLITREQCAFDQVLFTSRLVEEEVADQTSVVAMPDVIAMGGLVVQMTQKLQQSYVEYHRRVTAYEKEQASIRERQEKLLSEAREAREHAAREEAIATKQAARDAIHAAQTEEMEKELLSTEEQNHAAAGDENVDDDSDAEDVEHDERGDGEVDFGADM